MSRLLTLLAFCLAPLLHAAEPTTLKEVLAVEAKWKVNEQFFNNPLMSQRTYDSLLSKESASAFLARVASGRSDADRKLAAKITKANWKTLDAVVLKPAESVDAAKAKPLRAVLEKISASSAASGQDQAELKRLLDAAR